MAIAYGAVRGTLGAHTQSLSTGMLGTVYPSAAVLAEVGRVTIAGFRLDLWMGFLWAHQDRDAEESKVRWEPANSAGQRSEARTGSPSWGPAGCRVKCCGDG